MGNFPDGVFFIGLAPLLAHGMIHAAIAEVFELFSYDDTVDLMQGVLNYLQSKQLLIVLDNFEHLLEGASLVSDILQAAPQVKILVTSRERLNLQGETVFTLSGMAFPPIEGEYIPEYDSVRLFVNGTRRVRPDYELNEFDLGHIIQICQLVDGMPLGIELASGWMDVMSAEKIADEIQSCIDILETDMRDVPERHRSIRATFNGSWDSLSSKEQEIMMRLSIFRGGFRQEAAEIVAGANIRILKRLVNKALLYVDPFGRYGIHELLRQYCEEKLQQVEAYEQTLDKHAIYYADYLSKRKIKLYSFDGLVYPEVGAELDNLLMAWEHMIAQERFDLLRKAIRPIWQYMSVRGRSFEAIEIFQEAIDALKPQMNEYPDGLEIYSQFVLHRIQLQHGLVAYEECQRHAQEIVELLEPFGESDSLADAYMILIETTHWNETNRDFIASCFENAQKIYQSLDLILEQAGLLYFLTTFHYFAGEHDFAKETLDRAIAYSEQHNLTDQMRVNKQQSVVEMYVHAEMYDEAEQYLDEALFILERAEWVYGIADARRMKLQIALGRDDIEEAKRQAASIISWHQSHGHDWQMLGALWGVYARYILMEIGEDERAAEILSFVINHPISVQSSLQGANYHLDKLRERMDKDTYEAAFERGKELELRQVVKDAMVFLAE